jgi:hypothetical protein
MRDARTVASLLSTLPARLERWSRNVGRQVRSKIAKVARTVWRELKALCRRLWDAIRSVYHWWIRVETALLSPIADLVLSVWAIRQFLIVVAIGAVLGWLGVKWHPVMFLFSGMWFLLVWSAVRASHDSGSADDEQPHPFRVFLITVLRFAFRLLPIVASLLLFLYHHVPRSMSSPEESQSASAAPTLGSALEERAHRQSAATGARQQDEARQAAEATEAVRREQENVREAEAARPQQGPAGYPQQAPFRCTPFHPPHPGEVKVELNAGEDKCWLISNVSGRC